MLIQTLVCMMFLLALSGVALGEAALMVRIDRAHLLTSITAAFNEGAMEDARQALAQQQAHPDQPSDWFGPTPHETSFPLCLSAAQQCGVVVRETFTRTDFPVQNPTAVETALPCQVVVSGAQLQVCNLEQGNGIIEGRSTIRISIQILSTSGAEIASTRSSIRLRTLNFPPYALIVGIANPLADNPLGGTGDVGGIPSNHNLDNGTLITTVDPCRHVPANSTVGVVGEGLTWGNWQGTEHDTGTEMPCVPEAGSANLFATGGTQSPATSASNWAL